MHVASPLIESKIEKTNVPQGSGLHRAKVYLKMENQQPSRSFKIRGVGFACSKAKQAGATELVSSSGGNAGLAVAYAGKQLGLPVTVVVPETCPEFMQQLLKQQGATVQVTGGVWDQANQAALSLLESRKGSYYIHPFDDPDLWQGHSSMIEEIKADLPKKPALVVCSVGGGGLYSGVVLGLKKCGWSDVPILAVETQGADSFASSMKAGKLVSLPTISSIAKSLGAKQVSSEAFKYGQEHPTYTHTLSDKAAVKAIHLFKQAYDILLEPACTASLASIYDEEERLPQQLADKLLVEEEPIIVIIVCGGNVITDEMLQQLSSQLLS